MKLFTILALVGIAATAAAATPTVVTPPQNGLTNATNGTRRLQHLAAMPEQIEGIWVHVVGDPGMDYALYALLRDGTSFQVGGGVIPASGRSVYAWAHPHNHVEQHTDRVEIWSFANGHIRARVEFLD